MRFLTFILLISFNYYADAQYWGRNTQSLFNNEALDVETDANGNVYITGYITGSTTFNNMSTPINSSISGDIYIAKYNSQGDLVWVQDFGGPDYDRGENLAIDQNGDIYVTGEFSGTVSFGSFTLQSTNNSRDVFLIKMDPLGNVLWAISEGGNGIEDANGIATDNQNNVIITGRFNDTTNLQGNSFPSQINPNTGLPSFDLFICKYDFNGSAVWSKTGNAKFNDKGTAVSTDNNNNIYLIGMFSDSLLFDGQMINNNALNTGMYAKLNPSGQMQWFNRVLGGGLGLNDIEVGPTDEVFITGNFMGGIFYADYNGLTTNIFGAYANEVFVIKTTNDGLHSWNALLGSENDLKSNSIAIDNQGNSYVAGGFECYWTELNDTSPTHYISQGYTDPFIWKVSAAGVNSYVRQQGGKKADMAHGVAIMGGINPVMCGSYAENLNFRSSGVNYQSSSSQYDLTPMNVSYNSIYKYLDGDPTANSFVTNALSDSALAYTFYGNYYENLQEEIPGYFNFSQDDTIHLCPNIGLYWEGILSWQTIPLFSILWNTGETTIPTAPPSTSGYYWIELIREDGCPFYIDTIYVELEQNPTPPLLSDDEGIIVNGAGPFYGIYEICCPDSIGIWFTELDPGNTIQVSGNGGYYYDTLIHNYCGPSQNHVVITSNEYCSVQSNFWIIANETSSYDIEPYIQMVDGFAYSDSIAICNNIVSFHLLDSLNNPNAIFGLFPEDTIFSWSWTFSNGTTYSGTGFYPAYYEQAFSPSATGWYTATFTGTFGYSNSCGTDTMVISVSDSFYIEIISPPPLSTTIIGNALCPGDSVYLSVTNTYQGATWYGSGIIWTSNDGDSILVIYPGWYSYVISYTDTIAGCTVSSSESYFISGASPPYISVDPYNGLVCPGDSILLYVYPWYTSYEWVGPNGVIPINNDSIYVSQPGFYYVNVIDNNGCQLTSPPEEIVAYSTPFLLVYPDNIICEGDYATISVNSIGSPSYLWNTGSFQNTITVNQAGWYVCNITQCGITTTDSVEILGGATPITLNMGDSTICFPDTAVITATAGLTIYDWSTGEYSSNMIISTTAGDYWLTAYNEYNCPSYSDTITLQFADSIPPPNLIDESVCIGDSVTLSNSNLTSWYTSNQQLIATDTMITLIGLTIDTAIIAVNVNGFCESTGDTINIEVVDSLDLAILGSTEFCDLDSTILFTNADTVYWYIGGIPFSTNDSITISNGDLTVSNIVTLTSSNTCFTLSIDTVITVFTPEQLTITPGDLIICPDDSVALQSNISNTSWDGDFGQEFGPIFNVNASGNSGFIYANAIDSNGCSTNSDTVSIDIIQEDYTILESSNNNCFGDSLYVDITGSFDSYNWTGPGGVFNGPFSVIINDSTIGYYHLTLLSNICVFFDSLLIEFNPSPTSQLPEDTLVCNNSFFNVQSILDYEIIWEGQQSGEPVLINGEGWYVYTLTNDFNCSTQDSIYIYPTGCSELPNVITSNQDGINDYFTIEDILLYPNNYLIIFNRWGNVVFSASPYQNDFNGGDLVEGTYFYHFYPEGINQPETLKSGFFELIKD